jgi:hypothetical protein
VRQHWKAPAARAFSTVSQLTENIGWTMRFAAARHRERDSTISRILNSRACCRPRSEVPSRGTYGHPRRKPCPLALRLVTANIPAVNNRTKEA